MALSLFLARAGVPVTLLEAHRDYDRDFRGDTIHPATLDVLHQIGLAQAVHELPHVKAKSFRFILRTAVLLADSYWPVRRASSIAPLGALRNE